MRQRVKMAQALIHDPRLLILDEPLSGIDPVGRQEFIALFRELEPRGKCLLVSSHELDELEKLTDHVAVMARGRIAAVGTLTQIRDLLDDQPLSVRLECDQPRRLAAALMALADVVGVELPEEGGLVVRAQPAQVLPGADDAGPRRRPRRAPGRDAGRLGRGDPGLPAGRAARSEGMRDEG